MRLALFVCIWSIAAVTGAMSQGPFLLPTIGLASQPQGSDSICPIPVYQDPDGTFSTTGYQPGDTVADFTLYTPTGTPVNLWDAFQDKLPILLVSGNYTCPVFRDKVPDINQIANQYTGLIKVYVVYGVEAHPAAGNPSPYSGTPWVTSRNQQDGVLYPQPVTMLQRRNLINTMQANLAQPLTCPILMDGPCNPFWLSYGQAPNSAWLIDTNGVVYARHGWFHRTPLDMYADIDSLLAGASPGGGGGPGAGTFSFQPTTSINSTGAPGDVLYSQGMLRNLSATDPVTIDVIRHNVSVIPGWSTALCLDICLATWIDSTQVTLNPLDSALFTFYFYTDTSPNVGQGEVIFRNAANPQNQEAQYFTASTEGVSLAESVSARAMALYPNPSNGFVTVKTTARAHRIEVLDVIGRVVHIDFPLSTDVGGHPQLDLHNLPTGLYTLVAYTEAGRASARLVLGL